MKVKRKMRADNQGGKFAGSATWEIPESYDPDLLDMTSGKVVSTSVRE